MIAAVLSDVVDITRPLPDPLVVHWAMIEQIHRENMIHPCAEELVFAFRGTAHIYQFAAHFPECDDGGHKVWAEDEEFVPWAKANLLSQVSEPIRSFNVHWRMPDFSLASVVLETEGYVHDFITIPALGRPAATEYQVGDLPMDALKTLAIEVWGAGWSQIPCTHKQEAAHDHEED